MKEFYEILKKYKKSDFSSFHTPGHKGNFFSKYDLISLDFTELSVTDSLYEASGIIKNLEIEISQIYDSGASFISCGGNTLCIQAMMRLAARAGDTILCDRVIHRSAVSAMGLLNINPVWIKRRICEKSGLASEIDLIDLENKLKSVKNVKAVYLTSPSYHGVLQNIREISKMCKKYGVLLLVDNAHGSHLKFFDLHPLDLGADITCDSAHKTLPVLTGGAWLHINKNSEFNEKLIKNAKSAMALFGSTSPSYITMASMSICAEWLKNSSKQDFLSLKRRNQRINLLAREKNIFLTSDYLTTDPTRIVLGVFNIGYTGFEFSQKLREFNIESEFCDENYVVLIPSPFNTEKDWEKLENFIKNVEIKNPKKLDIIDNNFEFNNKKMSICDALSHESQEINIENCVGKIAADIVCPCPPGIPVVMPGEKIDIFSQKKLINYNIKKINVLK